MDGKHTPGPWVSHHGKSGGTQDCFYIHSEVDHRAPRITTIFAQESFSRTKADAALIAAAPELLEALKETLDAFEAFMKEADWGKSALSGSTIYAANAAPMNARAAIAKAEGQQ